MTLCTGPQYRSPYGNWLFPHGGGQNGYADYLRAADFYRAHTTSKQRDVGFTAPYDNMKAWSLLIDRSEPALKLIASGNMKSVSDPRTTFDETTLFPEYADFKALEKILAAKAYRLAKNGHSREATDCLLEGLKFSEKMPPVNLISYLISIAGGAIQCRSAYMCLPYLAPADLKRVSACASQGHDQRRKLERTLNSELNHICKRSIVLIDTKFGAKHDESYFEPIPDPEPEVDTNEKWEAVKKQSMDSIKSASKDALRKYAQEEQTYTSDTEAEIHHYLAGPETRWSRISLRRPKDPALWLFYYSFQDFVIKNVTGAAARHDSQIRLLRSNCILRLYNHDHRHYPKTLGELGQTTLTVDPRTEREFEYALTPNGYTLGMYAEGSLKPKVY